MREVQRAKMRKGFTLIEIIAALAIIGLGLVGILSLFPVGIDASKRAGDLTNATVLAQGVISQIRSAAEQADLTLNNAKSLFPSSAPQDFRERVGAGNVIIPIVEDAFSQYHELYQYQVQFDDPPKAEKFDDLKRKEIGLQKVTVTVSWPFDEQEIALRNRVTLVTFLRFPE